VYCNLFSAESGIGMEEMDDDEALLHDGLLDDLPLSPEDQAVAANSAEVLQRFLDETGFAYDVGDDEDEDFAVEGKGLLLHNFYNTL
jgi:hypothetical protein